MYPLVCTCMLPRLSYYVMKLSNVAMLPHLRCKHTHIRTCACVLTILDQCFQKNKPGRIIILYDEDERVASQAATTFVQREVDNVLMLSGGKAGKFVLISVLLCAA